MKRTPIQVLGAVFVIGVVCVLLYWFYRFAAVTFQQLFGSFDQVIVAVASATAMALVGMWLTMGKGRLAEAGQLEKISIWAALLLSTVSAMTTGMGLLRLFSANPTTGSMLLILISVLLCLGIQLSMLMCALRLGESIQRLSPVAQRVGPGDDMDPEDVMSTSTSRRAIYVMIAAIVCLYISVFLWYGDSIKGFIDTTLDAIVGGQLSAGTGISSAILAPVFVVVALVTAIAGGLLRRPATLGGIGVNFSIYLLLLTFSSGFGFLAYFQSTQSDPVRAVNRDTYLETNTSALVRQIQDAAAEDERDALTIATTGPAATDLAREIDSMAELFVRNRTRLDQQLAGYQARNAQLEADRIAAQASITSAEEAIRVADLDIANAATGVKRAQEAKARRLPGLENDLKLAEEARDAAARGDDGTNVALCGPNCRREERRIEDINGDIQSLDEAIAAARIAVTQAESAKKTAELALERAKTNDAGEEIEEPRPPLVDRSSFTIPLDQYRSEPSTSGLAEIERTCSAARGVMQGAGIFEGLPRCQTAEVRTDLARYEELKDARTRMVEACTRSDEQIALEKNAPVGYPADAFAGDGSLPPIPTHLQGRLTWVVTCLTTANTGSPRMTEVAKRVNNLRSEYTSPGYDPRRVVRSLAEGDLFAIFSIIMAVLVDTAILIAGYFALSQRSDILARDHLEQAPDRLNDAIENALSVAGDGDTKVAALVLSYAWKDLPEYEAISPDYTRKLSLDGLGEDEERAIRLVLDSAGVVLVKYVEKDGVGQYQLHQKFVQLINSKATHGGIPLSGKGKALLNAGASQVVDVRASRYQNFTPLFEPSPSSPAGALIRSAAAGPNPRSGPKLGPGET